MVLLTVEWICRTQELKMLFEEASISSDDRDKVGKSGANGTGAQHGESGAGLS